MFVFFILLTNSLLEDQTWKKQKEKTTDYDKEVVELLDYEYEGDDDSEATNQESPNSPTTDNTTANKKNDKSGIIIGIVFAIIAGLSIISAVTVCVIRNNAKNAISNDDDASANNKITPEEDEEEISGENSEK